MQNKETRNPDALMETFYRKCKQNKLKLTPQRIMLYRELISSEGHPTAHRMYQKTKKIFPTISFDTVNRTLLTFSKTGIIRMVEGYGSPRCFDSNPLRHHHFRCIRCMDIEDIYDQSFDGVKIPPEIENTHVILEKKVVLEGICRECQGKKKEKKTEQGTGENVR